MTAHGRVGGETTRQRAGNLGKDHGTCGWTRKVGQSQGISGRDLRSLKVPVGAGSTMAGQASTVSLST